MIVFYDDLAKSDNPIQRVLEELRRYLDASEPSLVRVLMNTWNAQGKAITYKELREALLYAHEFGGLAGSAFILKLYEQWRQDYSRFVIKELRPRWEESMETAMSRIARKYPLWSFDETNAAVRKWAQEAGAIFVTNSTTTQILGLQKVIERAVAMQDISVDALSQAIRPMVGLTHQQTAANLRYYENLLEHGATQKQALNLATRYGARQHRYRAQNIARTELAFAYNQGGFMGVKAAQEQGLMGKVEKRWCTADDERTCKHVCAPLDGVQIPMDEEFNFRTRLTYPGIKLTAPAHPSCRCEVLYIEVEPPKFNRNKEKQTDQ